MTKPIASLIAVILFLAGSSGPEVPAADFYAGKTIRLVVGYAPGGGYDFYARTIARHMGKHITGNPAFIVENMPGAGSLVSANHLYKIAKPDGLTIGHFNGNLFQLQAMGQKEIDFNAARFEYVGAVARVEIACGLSKASGIDSEQMAGLEGCAANGRHCAGNGGLRHVSAAKLDSRFPAAIGAGLQEYGRNARGGGKGRAPRGLHGVGKFAIAMEKFHREWGTGDCPAALPKPHMELPKVPLAINFAKTEEARQLIQIGVHDVSAASRPFMLSPGTPKDRVQILRKAFTATMRDPSFLADAERASLDIAPLTGEELEKTVHGLLKTSPAMLAKLKQILAPQ